VELDVEHGRAQASQHRLNHRLSKCVRNNLSGGDDHEAPLSRTVLEVRHVPPGTNIPTCRLLTVTLQPCAPLLADPSVGVGIDPAPHKGV